jgi:hypothetical protein
MLFNIDFLAVSALYLLSALQLCKDILWNTEEHVGAGAIEQQVPFNPPYLLSALKFHTDLLSDSLWLGRRTGTSRSRGDCTTGPIQSSVSTFSPPSALSLDVSYVKLGCPASRSGDLSP